uniref:VGF nerve growth factor inducible n=1 Tax=Takifugu rubripes TaxID=31033 RepID=A0A674PNF3_TAKRU
MIGPHDASSALSILIILTGSSCLHLAMPNPNRIPGNVNDPHTDTLPRLLETLKKEDKEEEEEDLFKDMDPQTLAAVLVESLNHSQVAKKRDGKEQKEDVKVETVEGDKEYVNQDVPIMERADRDRQLELELMLAAQGKEQDKERENELKKALEEEEKVTEKVTSHTTSQDIHVQMEQLPKGPEEGVESQQDVSPREGPDSNEEEEQLSPEELKSLETMMQVFPRLNTVTKREQSLEQNERDIRDYSSYNDVIPLNKGNNLAMTKKKLKWQEETQKALNFPTFGSNFMDEFENNNYDGGKTEQLQNSVEQELLADDEPEENDSEDALSPEEEEARAKAEQEEMRRQAAEAQRAKMEEEKLADIASDMLLRYMGKQGNGNKKHSSNAMEDKRSDEEQEVAEENDIDPQTIDKLIEISSKLHLPADDVVDIISDVEKKKKKDMPSGVFHQQPNIVPPSFSSKHVLTSIPISTEQNRPPVSKFPSPALSQLKTWFRDRPLSKSPDIWGNLPKPLLANRNQPKTLNPLKQEFWIKSLKKYHIAVKDDSCFAFNLNPFVAMVTSPGKTLLLFFLELSSFFYITHVTGCCCFPISC